MKTKTPMIASLMAACALLTSAYAAAEEKKGSGWEYDSDGNKISFESVTTFDENGIYVGETRTWFRDDNAICSKSVDAYDFFGNLATRQYEVPIADGEWKKSWTVNRYYDVFGNMTGDVVLDSNNVILSAQLWSFSEQEAHCLTNYCVWDAAAQKYVCKLSTDSIFNYVIWDDKGRVGCKVFLKLKADGSSFETTTHTKIFDPETDRLVETRITSTESEAYTGEEYSELYFPGVTTSTTSYYSCDGDPSTKQVELRYSRSVERKTGRVVSIAKNFFENGSRVLDYNWKCNYNEYGDTSSISCYNANGMLMSLNYSVDFLYDEYDVLQQRIEYRGADTAFFSETNYSFEAGKMISSIEKRYNAESGSLVDYERVVYEYGSDGKETTKRVSRYAAPFWVEIAVTHTIVDDNGCEVFRSESRYVSDRLREIYKAQRTFDSLGNITSQLLSKYDDEIGELRDVAYCETEYNEYELQSRKLYYFDGLNCLGAQYMETIVSDKQIELSEYEWDSEASDWFFRSNQVIILEEEDAAGLPTANIISIVRGGQGRIEVTGSSDKSMRVVNVSGMEVYNGAPASVAAQPGLYVVEIDGKASIVAVR